MNFKGFHHIGLFSKDTKKSLEFYTKGLGGEIVSSFPLPGDESKWIYLVDLGGNSVIEIIPLGVDEPEERARWAHVCFNTEDVKSAYEAAVAAGAKTRSAPNDVTLGTVMDVTNAFVYGPDDEIIEFFNVKKYL